MVPSVVTIRTGAPRAESTSNRTYADDVNYDVVLFLPVGACRDPQMGVVLTRGHLLRYWETHFVIIHSRFTAKQGNEN